MKKFLLMAALVAAAGVLVTRNLIPVLKSRRAPETARHGDREKPPRPDTAGPAQPPPPTDGEALYLAGNFKEAIAALEQEVPELEAQGSRDAVPHIEMLAKSYASTGLMEKAEAEWMKVVTRYPWAKTAVADADYWLAQHASSPQERRKFLDEARSGPSDSDGAHLAEMDELLANIEKEGKEFEARAALSKLLHDGAVPAERAEAAKKAIVKANERLVFSTMPTADSQQYTVVHGDTLNRIALEHRTTVGLLKRINGLPNNNLRIGNVLKVLPCDGCELVVSLTDLKLSLWLKGNFIQEYPVCVGDPRTPTPDGAFTIEKRVVDPPWKEYPHGDPRNILGSRWMGFKSPPSIGVHGTTEPQTVPGRHSAGCVRMLNANVEEVYDFAIEGTKVTIKR